MTGRRAISSHPLASRDQAPLDVQTAFPGTQAMREFAKLKQIAERFRRYEANCREKAIAARDERRAARMLAHADRWRRDAERLEKAADDSRVRRPPQAP
jgi:hypothetical protein